MYQMLAKYLGLSHLTRNPKLTVNISCVLVCSMLKLTWLVYFAIQLTFSSGCQNISLSNNSSVFCCHNGSFAQYQGRTIAFTRKLPSICRDGFLPELKLSQSESNHSGLIVLGIIFLYLALFIGFKWLIYRFKRQELQITVNSTTNERN